MDVRTKSIGEIIDALITASMRCWFAQEKIMDQSLSDKERLDAAIRAQQQNAIRSELIRAINTESGQETLTMGTQKTYYSYFDKK